MDDVRRRAAALWPDLRAEEVERINRFIPFPGTDLSARAIGFRGERPQLLLESLREEEMYQAVHRLRPHLPDVAPRRILIFSSLPIPRIPAEVPFLSEDTEAHVRHVRAGAATLRALIADGHMPTKTDVLGRMRAVGHALNRGKLDRLWQDILHAAGEITAARGLVAANDRRADEAYRKAVRAIAELAAEGDPVTPTSVARRLGIKKPNQGIRRAIAEQGATVRMSA